MTNKILFVALLLVAASCFTFDHGSDHIVSDDFAPTADNCSQRRVSSVYAAIAFCETSSVDNTASCIQNNLQNTTLENWDVFTKENSAQAGVSYWYYTNCSLVLNNYGRYNRTYMIWSSKPYQNATIEEDV